MNDIEKLASMDLKPFVATLWGNFKVSVLPSIVNEQVRFEISYNEEELKEIGRTEQDIEDHIIDLLQSNEGE